MLSPDTVRQLIADRLEDPLVESEWLCDVLAANAELINLHNQYRLENGIAPEEKFTGLVPRKRRLRDLLHEDLLYLCKGREELRARADALVLAEIAGPSPNAFLINAYYNGHKRSVICFRSPLLHFIHSAYSKLFILTAHSVHADCLPQHDPIMAGERYTDAHLLAAFFNDVELLFDRRFLSVPIDPPHFADPFEYCERVEGTRRFLLGHEIGHTVYPEPGRREWGEVDASLLPRNNIEVSRFVAGRVHWDMDDTREALANRLYNERVMDPAEAERRAAEVLQSATRLSTDLALSENWAEELWCDSFSLQTILQIHGDGPLEGCRLYEVESVLIGILSFFTIMSVVEVALLSHKVLSPTHPPAFLRREAVRAAIKRHPVFQRSPDLRATLARNWKVLCGFEQFVSGVIVPPGQTLLSFTATFRERLTPFGQTAWRALFDAIVHRTWNKYDFDIHKETEDAAKF